LTRNGKWTNDNGDTRLIHTRDHSLREVLTIMASRPAAAASNQQQEVIDLLDDSDDDDDKGRRRRPAAVAAASAVAGPANCRQ
jgi:hypothetical protein